MFWSKEDIARIAKESILEEIQKSSFAACGIGESDIHYELRKITKDRIERIVMPKDQWDTVQSQWFIDNLIHKIEARKEAIIEGKKNQINILKEELKTLTKS